MSIMDKIPVCDICGRSGSIYPSRQQDRRIIEMDEDGLWICQECRARLTTKPVGSEDEKDGELDEKLIALVGKSAGAICLTMNLPYEFPYQSIIDAASKIAYDEDRYMSAWSFVTQWIDGTTVWQSEDQRARALVLPDGTVQVEAR